MIVVKTICGRTGLERNKQTSFSCTEGKKIMRIQVNLEVKAN